MTPREKVPIRPRFQIEEDWDRLEASTLEALEREDHWVGDFIAKLAAAVQNLGRKK
jgi:hypothetical protein